VAASGWLAASASISNTDLATVTDIQLGNGAGGQIIEAGELLIVQKSSNILENSTYFEFKRLEQQKV